MQSIYLPDIVVSLKHFLSYPHLSVFLFLSFGLSPSRIPLSHLLVRFLAFLSFGQLSVVPLDFLINMFAYVSTSSGVIPNTARRSDVSPSALVLPLGGPGLIERESVSPFNVPLGLFSISIPSLVTALGVSFGFAFWRPFLFTLFFGLCDHLETRSYYCLSQCHLLGIFFPDKCSDEA